MTTNKSIEEMAGLQIELFKNFDGDKKAEFIEKYPEIWSDCYDIMEGSRYHDVMINSFLAGASAQKELSDKREAELMAVIDECKTALEEISKNNISAKDPRAFSEPANKTLTSINEKLEKLNAK